MFLIGMIALMSAGLVQVTPVSPGEPPRITEVVLDGFDGLPARALERLRRDIGLAPGDRLREDALLRARELAVMTLQEYGHPYADVAIDRQEDPTGRTRIMLEAQPGPIGYFGRIEIVGNARLDDGVIRRQLAFRPGVPFRRSALVESSRNLAALELLDSVKIEVLNPQQQPSEVETRIVVVEGKPQRLNFSMGYATEEKLSGEASWRHVNFLGAARTFGLRGKISWLDRGIEGRFTQPYFYHSNTLLGLQARDWHLRTPVFRSVSRGGQAAVMYTRGSQFSSTVTFISEIERSRIANGAVEDPTMADRLISLGLNPITGVQDGVLFAVAEDASWRTAPVRGEPRDGYVLSLHVEQGGGWLPGTFNYYNGLGVVQVYYTLAERLTLAERVSYGSIAPLGLDSGIPFAKRLFLGGANSLRGWGQFEVSPLSESGLPIGGRSLFESSSELRFPVVGAVAGVLFVDLGNVWRHVWDFRVDNLLYDAGSGVRYNSPFGLLRFDYAYQLNRLEGLRIDGESQRRPWRVHFSIGHTF